MNKNIVVVGAGYVGLSIGILLSQNNNVVLYDVSIGKVEMINKGVSPIDDDLIIEYLKDKKLNLVATNNETNLYENTDIVVIAVPTNYCETTNTFDSSIVEDVIYHVMNSNDNCTIVIKSTVSIGFTKTIIDKYNTDRIIFCPEFLRESKSLYDNLYPTRIVVGCDVNSKSRAEEFGNLILSCAKNEPELLLTDNTTAESIKLLSNTYLALRVAFFNEIDTFANINGIDSKTLIHGMGLDSRIGDYYNNPSFGYGGYCLPKDSKVAGKLFENIPSTIVTSIVESNELRKEYIVNQIANKAGSNSTIGIYRLIMKSNSDNYRESAIQDVMTELKKKGFNIVVFEPTYCDNTFNGFMVENNFDAFIESCDVIVANRYDERLDVVEQKVYTRDVFNRD